MFDPRAIRKDFPILSRTVHGKPLVYLDNAATSQKPRQVVQALAECYESYNSNVHRGVHTLSMEATDRYEAARKKVAEFIHAPSDRQIIFTRNTTESINLVAHTWARERLGQGDEVLTTEMEHHSNLVPWQQVAAERGARLRFIPVTPEGTLDLSTLDSLLNERTRLVAAVHTSNVLGTINPIQELARRAHEAGALMLVDGAQSVPHMPVDVQALDCDFLAFSAHKMLGPTGIGVLYVKESVLEGMEPFLRGGEMVREVWYERATWNELPFRFEAGTPNFADAIALGAAVDYLNALGMDSVRQHEVEITRYALEAFRELEDVEVLGPRDGNLRGGLIAFSVSGAHPHDLGTFLDREGIALRTGHHCVMPLHRKLGLTASARASFYVYNVSEEVDTLVHGLKRALDYFTHAVRRAR
ncbi:MAG: cysteine desulfurase [Chloroflexi bacterium]|nr:cysteine desulfurase [Chloroflexota bacterium]